MTSETILTRPPASAPIDQGDIIDDCPVSVIESYDVESESLPRHVTEYNRVFVLTQTCDLVQRKPRNAIVAPILDAAKLIADGTLKAAAGWLGLSVLACPSRTENRRPTANHRGTRSTA